MTLVDDGEAKEMNLLKSIICTGTLGIVTATLVAAEAGNDMDIKPGQEVLFQQGRYEEINQLVEERIMCLKRDQNSSDIEALVLIGEAAIATAPKNDHAYSVFFDVTKSVIDYSPDNLETRLALYNAQSRLVEKLLAERHLMEGTSEQIRQQAEAILGDFMRNIESRIIPDYQPQQAYVNVPPPVVTSVNEQIGFNPGSVEDAAIRQHWEKAIEDNKRNALMNKEQQVLVHMKRKYESRISSFFRGQ